MSEPEPAAHRKDLEMFVVYEKPSDYPHSFVVRKHVIFLGKVKAAGSPMLVGHDLEQIRTLLRNMGAVNIGRYPGDDPAIKEVWL